MTGMFGRRVLAPAVSPPFVPEAEVSGGGFAPQQPQPQQRGGFFGQGGTGRAIAGSIGDFLLQNAGAAPVYAPSMQMKLRERMQQLQEERAVQRARDQFLFEQNYRRENPLPQQPTDFERTLEAAGYQRGSSEWQQLMRQRAANIANPMMAVDVALPDGSVRREYIRPGAGGDPMPPEVLDDIPDEGGPSLTSSGGFRPPF